MSEAWYIAFGALAGVFAFLAQCIEDAYRLGWRPYLLAFTSAKSLRKSMLVQLLACVCGGAIFGMVVAAYRILLD